MTIIEKKREKNKLAVLIKFQNPASHITEYDSKISYLCCHGILRHYLDFLLRFPILDLANLNFLLKKTVSYKLLKKLL